MIFADTSRPERRQGMDGFQFIETLHAHPAWRNIPIVVVTARDLSPDERRSLDRSARKIVRKGGYTRSELLDIGSLSPAVEPGADRRRQV